MADTVAADSSSTTVVTVGTPLAGTIETAYDQDWYRVALTAGIPYTIRMIGLGTASNTLGDPVIEGIYNSSDTYIAGFNNDGLISGPNGRDAMTLFTPAATTNYWIATSGDLGLTGTFQISVTDSRGSTDTVLATTATSGVVAVDGAAVSGTIDNATDVDWYKVTLTAATTYTIRVRGLPSNNGTLADPVIAGVYDSNGNYIANTYVDDLTTRDPELTLVAPSTGTYYIAADGWTSYTGTFLLDIKTATSDVAGNTSSSATLAIGSNTTVNMAQPYDHDWYGVTLTAGLTYQFSMAGTGSNNTPGIYGIFDSTGKYVGSYAAAILGPSSAAATTIFTPAASGTYYIDTYSLYEGTYTLSAAQVTADVPANTSTTYTVSVNGSVNGDIGGATDIDWYSVSLVAGTTYAIKMQGQQSGMGTLLDPMISAIYDASGIVVANTFSDDNDGNEASLTFRPASTGTYYIAADGSAGYTGSYKLGVTSIPGDVGQTTATAASVALNTPTLVTIDDASDTDWYAVTLTGGSTYGIRLQGAATQRGTIYDPLLIGVYDSTGTLLPNTYIDDARGLLNSILSFTPATTGTYYVAADGYDRFTGTVKLAVTIDDIGNTNLLAGSFAVGAVTEGTIDTVGDIDRYAVTLEASTAYYFRMQGLYSRNGDLTDPNISAILNGAGAAQTLTTINEATTIGLDSWVKLTTVGAGTYYIVAEGAGTDGAFLLTATKDIPGGTTTTASVTVGGSVTGFIDEGTDADWYSVVLNTNTSYVIKMLGVDSGNGTLADPLINGVRLSTTSTTIINGTSGTAVDNAVARDSVARLIPAANGTYYIAAENGGTTAVGTYVLSVAIEPGNTVASASASALTVGGSVSGTIDDTTDADWYKVTLLANTSYMFKMQGTDSGNGTLDDPLFAATGAIRNSAGTAVTGYVIGAVGMDSYVHYVPTAAGDYYIEAQGGGTDTGTFTLTAETEVGSTVAGAASLAVDGSSVSGNIDDSTDADWYSVGLTSGRSYVFKLLGLDSGNGTLVNPNIPDIRTAAGATLTGEIIGTGVGNDAVVRFVATSTANFIIDAQGTGGIGTYKVSAAWEAGDTNTSAMAIAVGSSLVGAIDDAADIDRYSVTLNAGTRYRVRMEGVDSSNGTLIDPYIKGIYNAAGTLQASTAQDGGGTGRDAYAIYTPGTTATYYIDADNGLTNTTAIGTYKLSVELWP